MRRLWNSVIAALLLAVLAAPALAEDVDITFLLTNDIYRLEGSGTRGGFARLAGVVQSERSKGGHLLYVHAGDTISPSLLAGFDQGAHVIDLLNVVPPDVFVPGNHEYDFGPQVFRERMAALKSTKLAANLRDAKGASLAGFADQKIFEFGPVKVGVVGLTADDSPIKSSPGDLKIGPTVEIAQVKATELRRAGADLVVAVVHANRSQDQQLFQSGAFDLILTGDDHDLAVFYNGRTVMAESKEEAEYVTAIDVRVTVAASDGQREVSWWPHFRIIDTAGARPDPETEEKERAYADALSKELDVVVGSTITALDSRRGTVRTSESAIGNLIADVMKQAVGADLALTNGGGIRGNKEYPPGSQLSRRDILTELPFGNRTVLLEVTGKDVLAALEHGFSQVADAAGRFPQVSGVTVEADLTRAVGARVVGVKVGAAALDPLSIYKLATNDFMANGGDDYAMLKSAKQLLGPRDAKLMATQVSEYIAAAGTVSPKIEGRIVLTP